MPSPRSEVSARRQRSLLLLVLVGMVAGLAVWHASRSAPTIATERSRVPAATESTGSAAAPVVDRERTEAVRDAPEAQARSVPSMPDQLQPNASPAAGPRGFRATPEQRMADLLAFQSADNLLALRDALQPRAAAGDADAANRLADIYDECAGVQWAEQEFARPAPTMAGVWPGSSADPRDPRRLAELAIGQQRCRGVIPAGDPKVARIEMLRALKTLQALARELGYPGILPTDMSAWQKPEGPDEWARSAALALLADGTPEALLSLSDSIAGNATHYSGEAWFLAACDLGYPCNMPVAYTRVWCVQYGTGCDTSSRLEFTRQLSTPRQWRLAQVQRDEILAHMRNGRIDALMRPAEGGPGGGG